ncbi:glycosyltransferase family 2 protein [Marinomonas sp. THO17]|uniref:glycosyltransferase family 2 protein n=1 Tax=Marinomonas sp. THO17 TaxID=3149048 RepID=UPI00336BF91C
MISIVTPTYNRKGKVVSSIESSLRIIDEGFFQELIVVDDASQDGTYDFLSERFSKEISQGILKLIALKENIGVTGAKNIGVDNASGNYIVFMDSDDIFTNNAGASILSTISANPNYSIYFFRCIDSQKKKLIGPPLDARRFDLSFLINGGVSGECLPVLAKMAISEFIYPTSLRGCESLAYYKILHKYKRGGFLSDLICRVYDSEGEDRLCAPAAIHKRSSKMVLFNFRLLRYWYFLSLKNLSKVFLRLAYYSINFVWSKL